MPLTRVLEPEVMDADADASAYDAMDHATVNGAFADDLLACDPILDATIDVGVGTARIAIEVCRRSRGARILGVDLAGSMLALAASNVALAGFADRIRVEAADAKALPYAAGSFRCATSNTLLHHLAEPAGAIAEMWRVLAPGGWLFVRDLVRPDTDAAVRALVDRYAAGQDAYQRGLFDASLRAALTLDEARALTVALGFEADATRMTSDRHWTLAARKAS